jgi:hypothetical protein
VLGVQAGVDYGALPEATPTFGAVLGIEARRLPLGAELEAAYGFPQTGSLASGAAGHLTLWRFGARVCAPLVRGRFEIAPCAGAAVFYVRGYGLNAPLTRSADDVWWAFEAAAAMRVAIAGPVGVRLTLSATVPFIRPRFVIDGAGVVDRPSAVGLRAVAGPEVQF